VRQGRAGEKVGGRGGLGIADWGRGGKRGYGHRWRTQPMYNITVDEAHTYFVGDEQWLVHNACGDGLGDEIIDLGKQYKGRRPPLTSDVPYQYRLNSNGKISSYTQYDTSSGLRIKRNDIEGRGASGHRFGYPHAHDLSSNYKPGEGLMDYREVARYA